MGNESNGGFGGREGIEGDERNEGKTAGKRIQVKVCIGTNCRFKGSQLLLDRLENEPLLAGTIDIEVTRCIDHQWEDAKHSPVLQVDGETWRDAFTRWFPVP